MELHQLLVDFRNEIKAKYGLKTFAAATFAKMLKVDSERYRKWEQGAKPNSDDDRNKLKTFFSLDNLELIPNDYLQKFMPTFDLKKFREAMNEDISGIVREPESTGYSTQNDDNQGEELIKDIHSVKPKEFVPMINRFISLLEMKEKNMKEFTDHMGTLIRANDKYADAVLELVRMYGNSEEALRLGGAKAM